MDHDSRFKQNPLLENWVLILFQISVRPIFLSVMFSGMNSKHTLVIVGMVIISD